MNQLKQNLSNFYKNHQDFTNIFLLIILTFLIFYNSLHNYFVAYDEFGQLLHIKRNIMNILMTNIHAGYTDADSWRPLEVLSHIFDISLYGDENTFGRHLTNIVIHIFNVIFIYRIGLTLTKKRMVGTK